MEKSFNLKGPLSNWALIRMQKHLLGVFLIVFLLSNTIPIVRSLPTNGVLQVPYSSDVPIVDGQWSTPSEWNNASEYKFTQGSLAQLAAYFRLENNGTHLFILVDFITDQRQSGYDGLAIMFDTKDDGGNVPAQDDYRFSCQYGQVFVSQGTGQAGDNSWSKVNPQPEAKYSSGFSHTNDPYDNQHDHETYELSIPLSFLTTDKNMGFWAEVYDGNSGYVSWPVHISNVLLHEGAYATVSPPLPYDWGDIAIDAGPNTTITTSATPTLTITSPPTQTSTSTLTPTNSATPTPTPTLPEFSWLAILSLLISMLLIAGVLRHRKTSK
jgi:hypothetical protein